MDEADGGLATAPAPTHEAGHAAVDRHSYAAGDLVWGARFADILSVSPTGERRVGYTRFHDVVPG